MAKKTKTRLTFSLSIDMPAGMNIPKMREFVKNALNNERHALNSDDPLKGLDLTNVKLHLTNKETSYG